MKNKFLHLIIFSLTYFSCGLLDNDDVSVDYTPLKLNDGVVLSTPEKENIDPVLLAEAYRKAGETKMIKSLLVSRNGKLVAEEYFKGYNEKSEFEVRSITKSVVSLLTGIAIRDGYIQGVDQKVSAILTECFREDTELEKYDISIKNILTMTSGIDDWQYTGGGLSSALIAINSPHAFTPGKGFLYTDRGAHIMAVILNRLTGKGLLEYANENLFSLLGESIHTWLAGSDEIPLGCSGLELTGREMLKLGLLVQGNGLFDGNQIVPEEWIEESTTDQVTATEDQYGYFWWISARGNISAIGFGGQFIYLFPEYNAVITATNEANVVTNHAKAQYNYFIGLLQEYILPSFFDNQNQ